MPTLLHAACGPATIADLRPMFPVFGEDWTEVRLDIDGKYGADIVGDMRDIETWESDRPVPGGDFDAVYCSHAIEHLHLYDAPKALATFREVLKPGGFLIVIVPNFEAACRHVIEGRGQKFYDSPAGPIFAYEVIYGKENWSADNAFMRHATGYTPDLLRGVIVGAGFRINLQSFDDFNLLIGAVKP